MKQGAPRIVVRFFKLEAGIFAPSFVVILVRAIGTGHPDDLREAIGELTKDLKLAWKMLCRICVTHGVDCPARTQNHARTALFYSKNCSLDQLFRVHEGICKTPNAGTLNINIE